MTPSSIGGQSKEGLRLGRGLTRAAPAGIAKPEPRRGGYSTWQCSDRTAWGPSKPTLRAPQAHPAGPSTEEAAGGLRQGAASPANGAPSPPRAHDVGPCRPGTPPGPRMPPDAEMEIGPGQAGRADRCTPGAYDEQASERRPGGVGGATVLGGSSTPGWVWGPVATAGHHECLRAGQAASSPTRT